MSAKTMFRKLGYKIHYKGKEQMVYRQNGALGGYKEIIINDLPATNRGIYINYSYENQGGYLSIKELQAINKQIEELG